MHVERKYEEIKINSIRKITSHGRGHGKSTMMKEYLKYIIKRDFGV